MDPSLLSILVAAVVFAVLGIVTFMVAFLVIDRITPFTLWRVAVRSAGYVNGTPAFHDAVLMVYGICVVLPPRSLRPFSSLTEFSVYRCCALCVM